MVPTMGGKSLRLNSESGSIGAMAAGLIALVAICALGAGLAVANGGDNTTSASVSPSGSPQPGAQVNDQGWTAPTTGTITSHIRPPDRPSHEGTDIANAEGTPIWAASGGTVVQAQCTSSSCAVRQVGDGCGWTVKIDHGGGVFTRYCHMRDKPLVNV